MNGLATLQADGLDLNALGDTSLAELLEWHPVTPTTMPDADTRVLLWVDRGSEIDWTAGFLDGEDWRECESGGLVNGRVLRWAQPEGPVATPLARVVDDSVMQYVRESMAQLGMDAHALTPEAEQRLRHLAAEVTVPPSRYDLDAADQAAIQHQRSAE